MVLIYPSTVWFTEARGISLDRITIVGIYFSAAA
jgi:hypothetical protein